MKRDSSWQNTTKNEQLEIPENQKFVVMEATRRECFKKVWSLVSNYAHGSSQVKTISVPLCLSKWIPLVNLAKTLSIVVRIKPYDR